MLSCEANILSCGAGRLQSYQASSLRMREHQPSHGSTMPSSSNAQGHPPLQALRHALQQRRVDAVALAAASHHSIHERALEEEEDGKALQCTQAVP